MENMFHRHWHNPTSRSKWKMFPKERASQNMTCNRVTPRTVKITAALYFGMQSKNLVKMKLFFWKGKWSADCSARLNFKCRCEVCLCLCAFGAVQSARTHVHICTHANKTTDLCFKAPLVARLSWEQLFRQVCVFVGACVCVCFHDAPHSHQPSSFSVFRSFA